MTWLSAKISIANAVTICAEKGLCYAVISPGSRNAPLTISLDEHPKIECLNIPDERVAGFFALGLAQQIAKPVIICCTSGSAVLNYAPAIAEAFYQKIPLLILTADRPTEWIDQRAGQTMRQKDVFQNYVKASFEMMGEAEQKDHLWYNDRIVNQAIDLTTLDGCGPVHVNFPLRQPLYDCIDIQQLKLPKIVTSIQRKNVLPASAIKELNEDWGNHKSVLVIIGQQGRSASFDRAIESISILPHVVVLTETTSNVCADQVFRSIDRLIDSIVKEEYADFAPDLVISCGGALVSKKIRFMLRDMSIKSHWHVDPNDSYLDTYMSLTRNVPLMFEELVPVITKNTTTTISASFKSTWVRREMMTKEAHDKYLSATPWCDLRVMHIIHKSIPSGQLHVANSTPVRYTQLFETRQDLQYRSNRGVSGIDGCSSTGIGSAFGTDEMVTIVTGDIAFFYDSNAFWHHHVNSNLRVFMINNEGGNIFHFVKGPRDTAQFEKHFEAHHNTSAKGIAEAYGVAYRQVNNEDELRNTISDIYNPSYNSAIIIEIITPRNENIKILKKYFNYINEVVHS